MAISSKVLRSKSPFRNINPQTLEALAKTVVLKTYKYGDSILIRGDSDNKEVFLVYGRVCLESADKHILKISHHDPEASFGLSHLKPRQYNVIADFHDTCIIFIHIGIFNHLMQKNHELPYQSLSLEIIPK